MTRLHARYRRGLIIILAVLAMFAPVSLAVMTAPPAQAAEPRVVGWAPLTDPWGNQIGLLQIKYDGYALASYMFHKGSTLYKPYWTTAHLCYTWGTNGVCTGTSGYDSGNFGGWAGPAVPWPSAARDGSGAKAYRACGSITYGGKINQVCAWTKADVWGDMGPDGWSIAHF